MSEPDEAANRAAQMAKLDAKLVEAAHRQSVRRGKRHQDEHYSQAQQGWRMVIELVAGILLGFAIGYGLDAVFGTMPIFLIVFILLGFVAGVRVMMRTAKEFQAENLVQDAKNNMAPSADDDERD